MFTTPSQSISSRYFSNSANVIMPVYHYLCCHGFQWLGIGLLLGGLTACDDTRQNKEPDPVRPVKTMLVAAVATTPTISQVGDIEAHQQTALGFRISGRVLERRVDVGSVVHKGEVLATLDPANASHTLKQARAELESAKSGADLATRNFERMKTLLPNGAISQSHYDQAFSDWQSAKSRFDHAQATLSDAQDNLQFTQLTAPQSGVITATDANPGQVVSAGQQIFNLASNDQLDAVFDVPEQILQVGMNDPQITVSLLSEPTISVRARLRDITPQADPYTRTYRVRVTLIDPPAQMSLGMMVRGTLLLPPVRQIEVPKTALSRDGNQPAVYVYDPQTSELQLRVIELSGYSDSSMEVSAGLHPGDLVVIAGVDKLRPGLKVRLMQGESL